MTNYVYIAQSIDGFIAGPNGELDWLEDIDNPEQSDFGFSAFMEGIDALLMGKNTFEKVLTFGVWPYERPVFVASNTLAELPPEVEGKAFLISGSIQDMMTALRDKGHKNLYIDGGALIQSCLAENLIDSLIVTTVPVLLGQGIPLFGFLPTPIKLKLVDSEILLNQLVKTHYQVVH
jgi:dihydrofolate reductase